MYQKNTNDVNRKPCSVVDSKKGISMDNAHVLSRSILIKREWLNRFKIRDYDMHIV